jgi:hypothetical protein
MKFYLQNGRNRAVVNSESEEKALSYFLYNLIVSGKSTKNGELTLKPLTYVSQAGFFENIMAWGGEEMIGNAIGMKTTGSFIRCIERVSCQLKEDIAIALEKILVMEKQIKGSKTVINEFFEGLKT